MADREGGRRHEMRVAEDRNGQAEQEKDDSAAAATPRSESPDGADRESAREGLGASHRSEGSEEGEASKSPPPLPDDEAPPPLPDEAAPANQEDDGWQPVWEESAQAFYFYNRFTGASTWTNPRIPEAASGLAPPPGLGGHDRIVGDDGGEGEGAPAQDDNDDNDDEGETSQSHRRPHGGYDPAIHGDYDPTAAYAQEAQAEAPDAAMAGGAAYAPPDASDPNALYATTGTFNRFTGKWQAAALQPENFNDENKSRRQMNAFFDVDAAANSHDGKSLKAERAGKRLTKKEVKNFKEKRREKKEEKRRAWLRD